MKILLLFIWFAPTMMAGADDRRYNDDKIIYLQSIPMGAYHSIGFSNLHTPPVATISSANPATIANFSTFAMGMEYMYTAPIKLNFGITLKPAKPWLPTSFALVYPLKAWKLALSYRQKYASFLDFGDFRVITPEHPEGTGETFHATQEAIVHSPAVSFAHHIFNNFFKAKDWLALGTQIGWDFWTERQEIHLSTSRLNANKFHWKLGLLYHQAEGLGLGVTYEKGLHLQGQLVSEPAFIQGVDSTQIPIPEITLRFRLPDVLAFGVTTKSSTNLAFSVTLAAVFWHAVDRHYQDQLDLSVSSIYSWSPKLSLAVSFYKTDRDLTNYYEYGGINQNTTFLGAGVKIQGRNLTGRVEILDSHLFSGQYRKQTLVKGGVDYTFQCRNEKIVTESKLRNSAMMMPQN